MIYELRSLPPPIIRVVVPGRPPELHHGKDMNRWQRAAKVRDRKELVLRLAQGERNRLRLPVVCPRERRSVQPVVYWRGPERDEINLLQDLKADVDALVMAGLLVDDKRAWCRVERPIHIHIDADEEIHIALEIRLAGS